jgi:SPP1 gp7 family putative phage head morphogenesis protein
METAATSAPATAVDWPVIEAALARFLERDEAGRRNRATAKQRRAMQRELGDAFVGQGNDFLRGLAAIKSQFAGVSSPNDAARLALTAADWFPYLDAAFDASRADMQGSFFANVLQALVAGGGRLVDDLDLPITISFNLDNPRAVAYAARNAAEKVKQINDTTRDMVGRVIVAALEEGQSYGKTAKELKELFDGFSKARAKRIAVYEMGSAYENGKKVAAQEMEAQGLRMEKKWISVGDDRTRPEHKDNTAAGWIPMDETFPGDGSDIAPSDPNCRCSVIWRVAP